VTPEAQGAVERAAEVRRALQRLVWLKDGPRDSAYYADKEKAWQDARLALATPPTASHDEAAHLVGPLGCWCGGFHAEPAPANPVIAEALRYYMERRTMANPKGWAHVERKVEQALDRGPLATASPVHRAEARAVLSALRATEAAARAAAGADDATASSD
jgi:hypothetical protein